MRISDWSSDVCSSDLTATMMGGDAYVTQEFWSIAGAAGEGTLMTFSPDPRKNEVAKPVVAKFKAQNFEPERSEEHTSELQSLMRISYAVFCLKKQKYKSYRCRTQQYRKTIV